MDDLARIEAQKTWNARACGELAGEQTLPEYFERVEKDRYAKQAWAIDYFGFSKFRGQKVLEIGTGQGTDLMQFAKGGADCHGIDITDNHLLLTARNFTLRQHHVDLRKADAASIPYPDDYFDCVYSFGVLHHIPEIGRVLAEARRVLRPGGLLMIAVYHKWSAFHIFSKLIANGLRRGWLFTKGYSGLLATIEEGADGVDIKPYVRLYARHELRDLMRAFEVVDMSIHQLDADHFWPSFVGRLIAMRVPSLEPWLGWYLACKARKPSFR